MIVFQIFVALFIFKFSQWEMLLEEMQHHNFSLGYLQHSTMCQQSLRLTKTEEGALPTTSCDSHVALVAKPDKGFTRKLKTNIPYKYDIKVLNKIMGHEAQQNIKTGISHDQAGFMSEM